MKLEPARTLPRWSLPVVGLIWLCFLARGAFYCSFLPLWEGYDEWAHFAYIERLVTSGRLLVDRAEPVSSEVRASLELAPVPWEMRGDGPPFLTEDRYWQLPPEERAERQRRLRAIPPGWSRETSPSGPPAYEALQAPLYYWLLSLPYRAASSVPLADRVFLLRYISLAIASLAVPLVFLTAWRILRSAELALGTAALLTAMPGLMVDVCRVGNECLGVVLYSGLILVSLDLTEDAIHRRTGVLAGVALGLGLLTKAYFLTAVPALALLYAWRIRKAKDRPAVLRHAIATFAIALAIGGWWYGYNRVTTGTWSGLGESVVLRAYTWRQFLEGALHVDWRRAIDSILVSHIWFGGWSSLTVRSWMYHVLFWAAGIASAGVALALWRSAPVRRSSLYPLLAFYGFFWIGQLYNVLLIFLSKQVPASMGWYMYSVIVAETALVAVGLYSLAPGLGRPWFLCGLIVCFAALDLYTVHFVSIPYYTGLVSHRPNGTVAAFHLEQLQQTGLSEVLARLCVNRASWMNAASIVALWICYAVATLLLIGLPLWRRLRDRPV